MSAVIYDGATVVQRLKPVGIAAFEQCAIDIFKPYIMSPLNVAGRVDIQGGQFEVISPRETWIRHPRRVSPSIAVPKNGTISYELTSINKNYSTISHRAVRLGRYVP